VPIGDPLEWFGALVSPHLRQSQQDFAAGKLSKSLFLKNSQRSLS
jgi:hypothetical protein